VESFENWSYERKRTFPGPSRILRIWSRYLVNSASSLRILTSIESIRVSVEAMASLSEGFGLDPEDPKRRFMVELAGVLCCEKGSRSSVRWTREEQRMIGMFRSIKTPTPLRSHVYTSPSCTSSCIYTLKSSSLSSLLLLRLLETPHFPLLLSPPLRLLSFLKDAWTHMTVSRISIWPGELI